MPRRPVDPRRTSIHRGPSDLESVRAATYAIAGFQQNDLDTGGSQHARRSQAGHARADHNDTAGHGLPPT